MRDENKKRRSDESPKREDETESHHHSRSAERQHEKGVEKFFETCRFGKSVSSRITKRKRKDDGDTSKAQRVKRGLHRRDIEQRTASVDEEFFVVVSGETVLDLVTLSTIGFEAGEGADGEGK